MKKIFKISMATLLILVIISIAACNGGELFLSKTSLTLEVGASETITASATKDGGAAENVTWSSDKPDVASVSNGTITGVKKGTATIKATLGDKSVNINVTVKDTLGDYKTSKKTELDNYAGAKSQTNYTAAKWTELQSALNTGKTAINNAVSTAAVDTALTNAKNAIDAVSVKVAASIEFGEVSGTVTETEPVTTSVYGQAAADFDTTAYRYVDASLAKGDTEYSNVRFEISIDTPGALQLFAKDTDNNWYNVIVTGWGPAEGFPIADATTRFYIVGLQAGTHEITMKLVDVNNGNSAIITKTEQVTVIKPFSIEIGDISGTVTETQSVETIGAQAAAFDKTQYPHVDISLHKGVETYTNLRFTVSVDTAGAVQLFAQDTDGNWWNAVESGWGPPEGFAVADATTRFYLVGTKPGTHTITIKLINVSNGNTILTETAEVTVVSE